MPSPNGKQQDLPLGHGEIPLPPLSKPKTPGTREKAMSREKLPSRGAGSQQSQHDSKAEDRESEARLPSVPHPPTPEATPREGLPHQKEYAQEKKDRVPSLTRRMLDSIDPEPAQREESRVTKKYPSYVVRMANTERARAQASRAQPATKQLAGSSSSFYDLHYAKRDKVIRLDEAINSRPPMPMDLDGPGPTTYTPQNRPLHETNPPSWTMGQRTEPTKQGGSRTAWIKAWMHTSDVWTMKADFHREQKWPSPSSYRKAQTIGPKQSTLTEYPQHTFGYRRGFQLAKRELMGAGQEPSPNAYNIDKPSAVLAQRFPAYSHGHRRGGTAPWGVKDLTPGPADYHPSTAPLKTSCPAFTIRTIRRPVTHTLGPFSST